MSDTRFGLICPQLEVVPLAEQALEDLVGVEEEVSVPLQVLGVDDPSHQSLLYGCRLTGVMPHAVTHVSRRLDDQQSEHAAFLLTRAAASI